MAKQLLIIASLTLLLACEKSVNSGEVQIPSKYPTQLNREWEYNTTIKLEFYDSTGHIDSTEIMDFGNTICKITSLNDTIGNFSNLILFESYEVLTPQYVSKIWYLNADSGFYAIAYSYPGAAQPITPKANIKSRLDYIKTISLYGINPASLEFSKSSALISDSIQFYLYPRKVLKYPVRIGERWIELIDPFYRERFINQKQTLAINGNVYNCFKVESDWNSNVIFTDYINLINGLVMREVLVDSVALIGQEDPNLIGYYKVSSISKLVRETNP